MPQLPKRSDDHRPSHRDFEVADGARERLRRRVNGLRDPSAYPEEVEEVETVETHMSWVFLTDQHAFKLKKPIRTKHLDHRTVERRKRACQTELALNRRLAEPVYLGVVPVTDIDGELRVDGEGRPIDWLVQMRRLPRHDMLDERIDRATVNVTDIDRIGAKLTRFYQTVDRESFDGAAYRERLVSDIVSKAASLAQPRYGLDRGAIDAVVGGQQQWLETYGELLEARGDSVVEAHGDLRPEHVCLDGEPMIIDCLEFDRSLRLLDPISELAFLGLECRRLGSGWIGDRLLATYEHRTTDASSEPLVRFYQSYHAIVRAAVAIWHLDDEAIDSAEKWRRRSGEYLQIADHLI